MSDSEAKDLYQRHLDAVTRAFWQKDWDGLVRHLGVPALIRTLDAEVFVRDEGAMRRSLLDQRTNLDRLGAQDYQRLCVNARFQPGNADMIHGEHETFILRGGSFVLEPYRSEMTLHCEDGIWRAYGFTARMRNVDYTVVSPTLWQQDTPSGEKAG